MRNTNYRATLALLGPIVPTPLIRMSLTPDKVEVYRVESDGLETFCGYLAEIPVWAGRGLLEQKARELDATRYHDSGHPSLQLVIAA